MYSVFIIDIVDIDYRHYTTMHLMNFLNLNLKKNVFNNIEWLQNYVKTHDYAI